LASHPYSAQNSFAHRIEKLWALDYFFMGIGIYFHRHCFSISSALFFAFIGIVFYSQGKWGGISLGI